MAKVNSTQQTRKIYEAVLLFEHITQRDSDGLCHGEMRSMGQFRTRKEAAVGAAALLQNTRGAVGYLVRGARK